MVFIADLAEEIGRSRSCLLKMLKKHWPGQVKLLPRNTDRGIQQMAAIPQATAQSVRDFYRTAHTNAEST